MDPRIIAACKNKLLFCCLMAQVNLILIEFLTVTFPFPPPKDAPKRTPSRQVSVELNGYTLVRRDEQWR